MISCFALAGSLPQALMTNCKSASIAGKQPESASDFASFCSELAVFSRELATCSTPLGGTWFVTKLSIVSSNWRHDSLVLPGFFRFLRSVGIICGRLRHLFTHQQAIQLNLGHPLRGVDDQEEVSIYVEAVCHCPRAGRVGCGGGGGLPEVQTSYRWKKKFDGLSPSYFSLGS